MEKLKPHIQKHTKIVLNYLRRLEKDQKEWKMSRIWAYDKEMKRDVNYPPGGKE